MEIYDLAQESNSNIIPVDILNAITFNHDNDINRIILELQEMINELNLQDPITAERFIYIDDKILIELLFDEEIITAVISKSENNNIVENDESEINIISNKKALNSLEKVVQYFKNLFDNIFVNYMKLKTLNVLKSKINKQIQDNAKQTILDSFIQY
ncbi:hypothetical protein C1645_837630 [Glomus cerebriforme]|uniref:Uncharacterized protein n=1 Tax=Glomus cerebriforme TaxID=658196 RepID=A0A397SAN1_9GLOM|nr:hypothetical protein C1645_837630 [Glomus cerebriforme]